MSTKKRFLFIVATVSFITIFVFLLQDVTGQNHTSVPVLKNDTSWLDIGYQRLTQQERAMWILLGWGSLNLIGGSVLAINRNHRDFYTMMAGWGLVNAGIAGFALLNPDIYDATTSFSQVLRDEQLFNRILAINSGLNIGYMATGFCMMYMGKTSRIRQFGTAIIIQGAFLAIFDTILLLNSIDRINYLSLIPFHFETYTPIPINQWITGMGVRLSF